MKDVIHRIPPWLYFVMFLLVSYGVAREVWYRHWNHYAKLGCNLPEEYKTHRRMFRW